MGRQAQAAMEFVTTYGWALVVILVALGALTYFGVLEFTSSPNTCELWPEFSCDESQVTSEGFIHLMIRNNLQTHALVNVTLDTDDCTLITDMYTQEIVRNRAVLNGSLITFRCSEPLTRGATFSSNIMIYYQGFDQAIPNTKRGHLRRAVE